MSDPRFIPRQWVLKPEQFGRRLDVSWRQAQDAQQASELAAAQRQHELTYLIRRRLDEQGRTIRWFAQQVGAGYERTTRLLRGAVLMRIQDVTDAERILGPLAPPSPQEHPAWPTR